MHFLGRSNDRYTLIAIYKYFRIEMCINENDWRWIQMATLFSINVVRLFVIRPFALSFARCGDSLSALLRLSLCSARVGRRRAREVPIIIIKSCNAMSTPKRHETVNKIELNIGLIRLFNHPTTRVFFRTFSLNVDDQFPPFCSLIRHLFEYVSNKSESKLRHGIAHTVSSSFSRLLR